MISRYLVRDARRWSRSPHAGSAWATPASRALRGTRWREKPKAGRPSTPYWAAVIPRDTLGLWFAFFACLNGIYQVFSWLPAMLSAEGLDLAAASSGLTAYTSVAFSVYCSAPRWSRPLVRDTPLLAAAFGGAASAIAFSIPRRLAGGESHAVDRRPGPARPLRQRRPDHDVRLGRPCVSHGKCGHWASPWLRRWVASAAFSAPSPRLHYSGRP